MSRDHGAAGDTCALEFMDGTAIDMVRDYSDLGLPNDGRALLLMIEVDGPLAGIEASVARYRQRRAGTGCIQVDMAQTDEEVARL